MLKPISNKQIKEWLDNPVSVHLVNRIRDTKKDTQEALVNAVLSTGDHDMLKQEAMGVLLGYKAQIQILDIFSNLEEFLEIEEIENEEIPTD